MQSRFSRLREGNLIEVDATPGRLPRGTLPRPFTSAGMGYPGEDLSIPQLLSALNTKLSEQVRPFEYVYRASS